MLFSPLVQAEKKKKAIAEARQWHKQRIDEAQKEYTQALLGCTSDFHERVARERKFFEIEAENIAMGVQRT